MSITGKTADTPPGPSGPVPRKPWHKRRWVRIAGVIIGALVGQARRPSGARQPGPDRASGCGTGAAEQPGSRAEHTAGGTPGSRRARGLLPAQQ
jgi:hypothetical protein